MTNKQIIKRYLSDKAWVSSRQLQKDLFYKMNPETVTRECRRMSEEKYNYDKEIEKRKNNGFVEFQLVRDNLKLI